MNVKQSGFTKDRSTSEASVKLRQIFDAWEDSRDAIGVFCDLSKAFDYVHYDTLIRKLHQYGITGRSLGLLKYYLSDEFKVTSTKLGARNVDRFLSLADSNFVDDVSDDLKCFLADKKNDSDVACARSNMGLSQPDHDTFHATLLELEREKLRGQRVIKVQAWETRRVDWRRVRTAATDRRKRSGKVTIRPVLNGTVSFFGTRSRCPQERLRDAELSSFQIDGLAAEPTSSRCSSSAADTAFDVDATTAGDRP
ncbi:hypothetical protein EVAR_37986_1 [Eumeta japonica]|uniref:Uncharacterized protein n=1 Tax=Eumeta variegata TaxID=151549 RepID=A0A4C1YW09_EUMVA|nr:hypothetical protein EVAR_37986_1 [Eumeta japonica]